LRNPFYENRLNCQLIRATQYPVVNRSVPRTAHRSAINMEYINRLLHRATASSKSSPSPDAKVQRGMMYIFRGYSLSRFRGVASDPLNLGRRKSIEGFLVRNIERVGEPRAIRSRCVERKNETYFVLVVLEDDVLTRFFYFQSGNDSPARTAEHEIKVRFNREFADVGSAVTENHCSTPESLSSACSFRSLSSTLSVKSSSGICADSTPDTPDDVVDTSYVNSDIPGVEDLIFACADIHLGSDSQDLSQDQTFASAIDETSFHASDCSVDESLSDNVGDETRVIVTNPQLHETTACTSLNETCIFESPDNALSVEDTRLVSPSAEELHTSRVEGFVEKPVQLWQDDSVASEPETCKSNILEEPLPTSDQVNNNQLNITINVSPDNFDVSEVLSEEQTVENYRSVETPSPKHPLSPIEISVPSISPLIAQHAEDSSLPSISIPPPSLEDTDSKATENIVYDIVSESARGTSPTLLLVSDDKEPLVESPQIHRNSSVIEAEKELSKSEIIEKHDLPRLGNSALADNEANSTRLLKRSSIIEPKTSEVQENLESTPGKQDIEIKNITVSIETPNFLPKEDIAIRNETRVLEEQCDLSKTVIVEDPVPSPTTNIVKKKEISFEELNRTLTLQEIEDINLTPDEDQYEEFKPQRQSTTLSSLIKEQPDFEKFRFTAEQVTNELLNPSTDVTEEQFVSATSESKYELHVDVLKIFTYSLYSI